MVKVHSLISSVVSAALIRAKSGAGVRSGDIALGLVAALRRVRGIVRNQAGYGAACALDDGVREMILRAALEHYVQSTGPATAIALPSPSPATHRVALILEDVAVSAVVLNAWFPGNVAIHVMMEVLVQNLIMALGGPPDWPALADRLHDHDDLETEAEEEEDEVLPALH